MAEDGLTTVASRHGPAETADRLIAEIAARKLSLFARIDHASGATEVGLPLRPTMVLVFGNARGGTPLMQARQSVGIDLPLKILVWQDEAGATWMTYNAPAWIAARHGLGPEVGPVTQAMATLLAALTAAAGD
jgi:uncharacterized protein (DUF302 family)